MVKGFCGAQNCSKGFSLHGWGRLHHGSQASLHRHPGPVTAEVTGAESLELGGRAPAGPSREHDPRQRPQGQPEALTGSAGSGGSLPEPRPFSPTHPPPAKLKGQVCFSSFWAPGLCI